MSEVVRIARGCYLPAESADVFVDRCAAVVGQLGSNMAISGLAAARLHGLWLPRTSDAVEVVSWSDSESSRSLPRTRKPEIRPSRRQLSAHDVTLLDGLPVTTPVHTWWELASRLSLVDLVAAGDSLVRGGAAVGEICAHIDRMKRRRGNARAARALPLLDARSRSRPESHLRFHVVTGGLPFFEVNVAVHNEFGEWLAEPDLSCNEARIALEYLGEDHAKIERMRKDITRTGDLRRADWLMVPYGPAEVFGRPWQIVPELRHLISIRAPHLLSRAVILPPSGQL